MNIVYFTHSLASCWNHGNAHFIRGVLRELTRRGHQTTACEPVDGWSRRNLVGDHGMAPIERFRKSFPELAVRLYSERSDVAQLVDGADLVIAHEWTAPEMIAALGSLRKRSGRSMLFFHDTHHRAVSDPDAINDLDLTGYDGVLAFGEALADVYRRRGWGRRVFVWHEAADVRLFRPTGGDRSDRHGLIWIGNWGDGERTEQLCGFLLRPARDLGLPLDVYGVRYPAQAIAALDRHGARYHGWLANADVPAAFSRRRATVHVPRRFYAERLPGIPTIRMFEALACGIPLVSAPWDDCEGLFKAGHDHLIARDSGEMTDHLRALVHDADLCRTLAANGVDTILARHTCAHRVDELLAIVDRLAQPVAGAA